MEFDPFGDPRSVGILGMAAGGLQASGMSRTPRSLGEIMGASLQSGILARGKAEEIATQKMLREAQAKKMRFDMERMGKLREAAKMLEPQLPGISQLVEFDADTAAKVLASIMTPKQPKYTGTLSVKTPQGPRIAQAKDTGGLELTPYEPYEKPSREKELPLDAAIQERDKLPAGHPDRKFWDQYINKISTHQEPSQQKVILPPDETAEAKKIGEWRGEMYGKVQTAGMEASGKIARYDRLAQLLDGVETGKLTPVGTELAGYLASVGIKIDPKLDNKQAAATLSSELALQARNPSGGAGMPGAMSDQDRKYLNDMIPNLAKTPGGNRLIIETMKRLAQRDKDVARLAYNYRKKHKNLDGFEDELETWANANPLFSDLPQGEATPSPGLTPAEQKELDALRKKHGRK